MGSSPAALFVVGASTLGTTLLLLPSFWQEVRGATALTASPMMVPQGVGSIFSHVLAGRLTDAIGAGPSRWPRSFLVAQTTVPFAVAGPTTSTW